MPKAAQTVADMISSKEEREAPLAAAFGGASSAWVAAGMLGSTAAPAPTTVWCMCLRRQASLSLLQLSSSR